MIGTTPLVRAGVLTTLGLWLLATTGCTHAPVGARPVRASERSSGHGRQAASPSASPSPSPSPSQPSGPALAVGSGRLGPKDTALSRLFQENVEELLHEGQPVPPLNTVVVINRARGGGADFGWLPDATHFCLVSLHGRDVVKQLECGSLPAEEDAHTAAAGPFMRWLHPEKFPFYLAIVFNKPGPFRFTSGPGPTYGPLHQATAVFASGETATFLEYDSIQHRIEPREICNTDHSACFQTDDIPSLGTVTIEESESPTP